MVGIRLGDVLHITMPKRRPKYEIYGRLLVRINKTHIYRQPTDPLTPTGLYMYVGLHTILKRLR